jgi:exopolysaccharide biosynthesis polyprenyl glycosylphosphotransferase
MSVDVDRRLTAPRSALGQLLSPYPGRDRRGTPSPTDIPTPDTDTTPLAHTLQAEPAWSWLARYRRVVLLVDVTVLTVVALAGVWLRFGAAPQSSVAGVSYYVIALILVFSWWIVLAFGRCYETRFLGSGPEEFQRIANSSVRLCATVALFCYAADVELARGFVAFVLPVGTLGLLGGRYAGRIVLHRRRRRGRCGHRVVVVGTVAHVQDLALQLSRDTRAGMQVVGACIPGATADWIKVTPDHHVPVLGSLSTVGQALKLARADTIAVAASPGITPEALRRLSYELEGSGVELVVAPALTNVAGTRLSIRPVAGLPLLHIDEPELAGARKVLKDVFDRVVALVLLVLFAPLMIVTALLVRTTSPGPAIFRQERVGRDGRKFMLWKFRSMYVDAEDRRAELLAFNVYDGVMFKVKDDPRVTRVGRTLRHYSIDELPQLINVLRGDMSLVGPRPPLTREVEEYAGPVHRRLMVKPGMTGLWQVSGRNALSWEETVRLDLQYVENWSLALDISLLARTALTVVRGTGAY